jgi:hypothetical protein
MVVVRNNLYQLRVNRYRFLQDHAELRYMQNVRQYKQGTDDKLERKRNDDWNGILRREDFTIHAKRTSANRQEFNSVQQELRGQANEAIAARAKAVQDERHFRAEAKRLGAEHRRVVGAMQNEINAVRKQVNDSVAGSIAEMTQLANATLKVSLEAARKQQAEDLDIRRRAVQHWNASNAVKRMCCLV